MRIGMLMILTPIDGGEFPEPGKGRGFSARPALRPGIFESRFRDLEHRAGRLAASWMSFEQAFASRSQAFQPAMKCPGGRRKKEAFPHG
jgi:hypothetical protein